MRNRIADPSHKERAGFKVGLNPNFIYPLVSEFHISKFVVHQSNLNGFLLPPAVTKITYKPWSFRPGLKT